jgi:hypothetical protein
VREGNKVDFTKFSEANRVRVKRDQCGELIIPGAVGHIYQHGNGRQLGVLLMLQTKMQWTYAKRKLTAAAFTVRQDGDTEGTALFDPGDREQFRLAVKLARVRPRRNLTSEQRQAIADRLKHGRELVKAA